MPETTRAPHHRWDQMPGEQLNPLLERRLVWGEKAMVAQVKLTKGCPIPRHQHVHEQIACIVSGSLKFWLGDDEAETVVVSAGGVLVLPSNLWHRAEALEDTVVLDVFSPPREDWIEKTDDYLRR